MPGRIFISYRRADDPGHAGRLYDLLSAGLRGTEILMDVEGLIRPGDDFLKVIRAEVAKSDVLLAVIGARWLEELVRRRASPHDYVVAEIQAAFSLGKRVVPVLVGGAALPLAIHLPKEIRELAQRNSVTLRSERFVSDCRGLRRALEPLMIEALEAGELLERTEAGWRAEEEQARRTEDSESSLSVARTRTVTLPSHTGAVRRGTQVSSTVAFGATEAVPMRRFATEPRWPGVTLAAACLVVGVLVLAFFHWQRAALVQLRDAPVVAIDPMVIIGVEPEDLQLEPKSEPEPKPKLGPEPPKRGATSRRLPGAGEPIGPTQHPNLPEPMVGGPIPSTPGVVSVKGLEGKEKLYRKVKEPQGYPKVRDPEDVPQVPAR